MIAFHRVLFVGLAAVAFLQGAVNAGRKDMLEQYQAQVVLNLSLNQLMQMNVGM